MDIVSHGLWGGIAFGRNSIRSYLLAFLFGLAPDLLSFGIFFMAVFLGRADHPPWGEGHPPPEQIPGYIHQLYNISHSLIIFALLFFVLWFFTRRPVWESLAWGLHIIMDIFTHSYQFFPTPFLWPVSDLKFNGYNWSAPEIFFPNIAMLFTLYLWFFLRRRHRQ